MSDSLAEAEWEYHRRLLLEPLLKKSEQALIQDCHTQDVPTKIKAALILLQKHPEHQAAHLQLLENMGKLDPVDVKNGIGLLRAGEIPPEAAAIIFRGMEPEVAKQLAEYIRKRLKTSIQSADLQTLQDILCPGLWTDKQKQVIEVIFTPPAQLQKAYFFFFKDKKILHHFWHHGNFQVNYGKGNLLEHYMQKVIKLIGKADRVRENGTLTYSLESVSQLSLVTHLGAINKLFQRLESRKDLRQGLYHNLKKLHARPAYKETLSLLEQSIFMEGRKHKSQAGSKKL